MSKLLIEIPEPTQTSAKTHEYPNAYSAIPPNGKSCPHTGLKHSQLYKLLTHQGAARPYVRVASIKDPGASKGKTVFHIGDMFRYLDGIAQQQGTGNRRMPEEDSPMRRCCAGVRAASSVERAT